MYSAENSPKNTINMLWIGDRLGPNEQLSILSYLENGYNVDLYVYEDLAGIPSGSRVKDANEILPWAKMKDMRFGAGGSYALGADYFRLLLQRHSKGIWSDLDVVCLRRFEVESDFIGGYESPDRVCNAILYIDPNHPMLVSLLDLFENPTIPAWANLSLRTLVKVRIDQWIFRKPLPFLLPWGLYGVNALSEMCKKYTVKPQPKEVFYPLRWQDAGLLYDENFQISEVITAETCTLHLWNEVLRREGHLANSPSRGSSLGKLFEKFGIKG